jgi:hypothetical protein
MSIMVLSRMGEACCGVAAAALHGIEALRDGGHVGGSVAAELRMKAPEVDLRAARSRSRTSPAAPAPPAPVR